MARIRKTREFVGRYSYARIDREGSLFIEESGGNETLVVLADEVSELAAWLGQEIDRQKRFEDNIGGEDDGA